MPTSPEAVRHGLQVVTGAARADVRTVSTVAGTEPAQWRAAMFAAAPLIVAEYAPGSAELALDWFEEIRRDTIGAGYVPTPRLNVTDDDVAAMVAAVTRSLADFERDLTVETDRLLAELAENLAAGIEEQVAAAFRDTITENASEDPDARGWKRFARPEACKFCKMLAARGAVYTRETARFAAHGAVMGGKRKGGNCMCIAGPEFGGQDEWAEATPMQYVAAKRQRTEKERADLREYLNHNFPDAPG